MSDEAGGRGAASTAPLSLDELWALRSDFEDVTVPELGGTVLRLYALTGTARAVLLRDMADLADTKDEKDPNVVQRVLLFEGRVVAASLGHPEADWDRFGSVVGSGAIERLYEVAARLSGLDKDQQDKAKAALKARRSGGSGTG
jgi:hypothetical protein